MIRGRAPGPRLTSCASAGLRGGVVESTGEMLTTAQVVQRVGWLTAVASGMATRLLAEHWSPADLALLAAGVGLDGRKLPSSGWMALRRLGWETTTPDGMHGSDRVARIAGENAARLLRVAVSRDTVMRGVVASWPVNPARRTKDEWDALWAAVPAGTTRVEVRNRSRQIATFERGHDRLPVSITELEAPPVVSPMLLLAAADKQQVTFNRTDSGAVLRLQVPLSQSPARSRDWAWVSLPIKIPPHVPAVTLLHTPTLRLRAGRVLVDVPFSQLAPPVKRTGHVVALGFDWGLNTILTGTIGTLDSSTPGQPVVRTNGRPLSFDAKGIQAKITRLRHQRQILRAKTDQYARLSPGLGPVTARHALLLVEAAHVADRQRRLSETLARNAARWAVDQAILAGATVIYVEDLTSMEGRGMGRRMNARLCEAARGKVVAATRHQGAKVGIAVITVPARGTSKFCPRCLGVLKHTRAPDDPRTGWKWASCPSCALSADRDHAAAERIVSRGLAGQAHTRASRAKTLAVTKTVESAVRVSRDKRTPTLKRVRVPRVSCGPRLTRPVPAPASAGQRPAGHHPSGTPEVGVPQVLLATPTARTRRQRRRQRALSAGFHPHAHTSPTGRTVYVKVTPT